MNDFVKWGTVLIALFLLIMIWKFKSKSTDASGTTGVYDILRKLDKKKYTVFNYVFLPYIDAEGRDIDVDHIVVSVYGIFLITVQKLKGKITGAEDAEEWTQHILHQEYSFPNPVLKNDIRMEAMQSFLTYERFPKMPIYSIVVFPDETDLKVESGNATVTQYAELRDTIQNCYTKELIYPTAVKKLAETIGECTRLHTTAAMDYVLDGMENDAREESQIQNGICPKCDRPLAIRHGKFIDYYGCSGYPECNFTVDLKAVNKDD